MMFIKLLLNKNLIIIVKTEQNLGHNYYLKNIQELDATMLLVFIY